MNFANSLPSCLDRVDTCFALYTALLRTCKNTCISLSAASPSIASVSASISALLRLHTLHYASPSLQPALPLYLSITWSMTTY